MKPGANAEIFWGRAVAVAVIVAMTLVGCGSKGGSLRGGDVPGPVAETAIQTRITETRAKASLPALAAGIMDTRGISRAVEGVRIQGAGAKTQVEDRFHIGSNSKAFTATLIALYVEQGKLSWTTRILDVFPELAGKIQPAYQNATLEQLLYHGTGVPGLTTLEEIYAMPTFSGTTRQQREQFVAWILKQKPEAAPGTFHYSNGGYGIVAAMLERVTGDSYESLMRKRIFEPLGMRIAGFGWPSLTDPNSPHGHVTGEDGSVSNIDENDPALQVPRVIAPAGDIHVSVKDFARFVQMHLRGLRGEQTLLRPETIRKMHEPEIAIPNMGAAPIYYAMGWMTLSVNGVRTSYHNGSADTFYSEAAIQESRNRAVVTMTNIYSPEIEGRINELTTTLIGL